METNLTSIIVTLVIAMVATVGSLAIYFIAKLSTKATEVIKAKIENEGVSTSIIDLITLVKEVAITVVNSLNQTLVDELKSKSEDGKLTEDEIHEIKDKATEEIFNLLSTDVVEKLADYVDDIEDFIDNIIEDCVRQLKANFGTLISTPVVSLGTFYGEPDEAVDEDSEREYTEYDEDFEDEDTSDKGSLNEDGSITYADSEEPAEVDAFFGDEPDIDIPVYIEDEDMSDKVLVQEDDTVEEVSAYIKENEIEGAEDIEQSIDTKVEPVEEIGQTPYGSDENVEHTAKG